MTRRSKKTTSELFAVAAPGLAPLCAAELRALAAEHSARLAITATEPGGVSFRGNRESLYLANLHLRTASRILVRLGDFRAENFDQLRSRSGKLAWEQVLTPGRGIDVRVTCHKSRLYHTGAVAERIAAAIGDRLGQAPTLVKSDEEEDEQPAQLFVVRLLHDICTISVDSSGALLHRRGYRLATAKAPLRETLAAGLLVASGWDPSGGAPLLDPFCGSGTIPIEAAMLARRLAPGRMRRFAFMEWPDFDVTLWQSCLDKADEQSHRATRSLDGQPVIQASDRDAGAIEAAQANAARAGVADAIEFACRAVSAIEPLPHPGHVVTNPPYGQRVRGGPDLRNLYAQLGKVLRVRCPGWRVTLMSSDRILLGQTGLHLDTSLSFVNGGINVFVARGAVE